MSSFSAASAIQLSTAWRRALILLCTAAVAAIVLVLAFQATRAFPVSGNPIAIGNDIDKCITRYSQRPEQPRLSVEDLYKVNGLCYDSVMSQITVEQQAVRRDAFLFQRGENIALMIMVIVITLSGVGLAGAQLLTSYKLAVLGRTSGQLGTTDSELKYDGSSIVVKSSVVGVLILAISFAFFIVFVTYVYTISETNGAEPNVAASRQASVPDAPLSFNLLSSRPAGARPPGPSK